MASILESIPTIGLPVPNRMGMDAAIVQVDGEEVFVFSHVEFGFDEDSAENIISSIEKRAAKFGKIIVIDPVVLFPLNTSAETIRQTVLEVAQSARDHGMIVGKGHTEITSKIKVTTLIATVLGSVGSSSDIYFQK